MSLIIDIDALPNEMTFSDLRINAYKQAIHGNDNHAFVFAMYSLELLRLIQCNLVTPAHAYTYAVLAHNVEKTNDKDMWNKYLNQYKTEIELNTATHVVQMIADLACGILTALPRINSAGLPINLYNQIKSCDKKFVGFVKNPNFESLELSLKHLDITETDKSEREHRFTLLEIREMFKEFLNECIRPIRNKQDLLERTSKTALWYFTTVLAIIYRIFSKQSIQYWYQWEQLFLQHNCRSEYSTFVSMVPARTPEAVICWTGKENFSQKSIDVPLEINGVVDRYLTSLRCKL